MAIDLDDTPMIPFLKGNGVSLTPLTHYHLDAHYMAWVNDPDINRYTSRGIFPLTLSACQEYVDRSVDEKRMIFAIQTLYRDYIGNISLQRIDLINRSAELAILIGDKEAWGKGYGLEAARILCAHGFEQLGLNRIYCGTHQHNVGMLRLAEKLGMSYEGTSRQGLYKNGEFADIIHYGMLREEFREA